MKILPVSDLPSFALSSIIVQPKTVDNENILRFVPEPVKLRTLLEQV